MSHAKRLLKLFLMILLVFAQFGGAINCVDAQMLSPRPPNIIFLLTDDQGYGDLSCTGNPILKTPNMDRLHDEGVRFTDFHVSPTCSPTRSALMTGRHEFRNGVTHTILERERLTLKATTLAQVLKRTGYTTGIFGKWHLGDEAAYQPGRRGFDEVYIHGGGGIGQTYPGSCGDAPGNTYFDPAILHNGKFEKTTCYCTDVFYAHAIRWIDAKRASKRPFFAYIPCNAPHEPLQVRPEDEARYADKVPDRKVAKFFGMVANIDDNIGRLLDKLSEWKIERDTLVVFMNDNGGTGGVQVYNAGMRGQKVTPFLGGTRAASFWRWPGTLKPADVGALTAHIDFFPTIAQIAGAKLTDEVKQQVEGRSLVPLLKNPAAVWPDRFLFTHVGRWPKGAPPADFKYAACSVRAPRWQLVSASKGADKNWMLFDVKADPGERNDVAAQNPQIVAEMDAAYDRWWDSVQPGLVNEAAVGPATNPFKALYQKQFGVGLQSESPHPLTLSPAHPLTANRRPNVLFVIADQWRQSAFGFAGNGDVKTPSLDRFAAESIRFTNAVSTIPVCTPTRASLLTGQRALTHGVFMNDIPLSPDAVTFPKLLARAGYDTGFIGKWHVDGHGRSAYIPKERRQGFEYWKALECTHDYNNSAYYADDSPEKLRWSGYDTEAQTDDACRYLSDHAKSEKPFLLYLSWGPPHEPYATAPAKMAKLYADAALTLRPNVPAGRREIARRELRGYYAHCTALDECFERLMRTCRDLGLDDNTIVIFTSDHGDMLWSHGAEKKQQPFEESARVPLLVRYPAKFGRTGRAVPVTIGTEDIMPTLVRLCGLPAPRTAQGLDFSGYLSGGKDPSDGAAAILCPAPFGQWNRARGGREYRAIRTQRWTYAADLKGPWLLFDNESDPYQRDNLVGKPERADLQQRMDQWLRRKLKARKDDFSPGPDLIEKWGYTVDATGTVPYAQ